MTVRIFIGTFSKAFWHPELGHLLLWRWAVYLHSRYRDSCKWYGRKGKATSFFGLLTSPSVALCWRICYSIETRLWSLTRSICIMYVIYNHVWWYSMHVLTCKPRKHYAQVSVWNPSLPIHSSVMVASSLHFSHFRPLIYCLSSWEFYLDT